MPKATFIQHDGTEESIEIRIGMSLMQGAMQENIEGIEAECGGCCMCATCHVYVNEEWLDKVGTTNPTEEAMLSLSTDRKDNSRLSCQIPVTEDLDGLIVTTPEFQY